MSEESARIAIKVLESAADDFLDELKSEDITDEYVQYLIKSILGVTEAARAIKSVLKRV